MNATACEFELTGADPPLLDIDIRPSRRFVIHEARWPPSGSVQPLPRQHNSSLSPTFCIEFREIATSLGSNLQKRFPSRSARCVLCRAVQIAPRMLSRVHPIFGMILSSCFSFMILIAIKLCHQYLVAMTSVAVDCVTVMSVSAERSWRWCLAVAIPVGSLKVVAVWIPPSATLRFTS